jgi:hypothetical protein
MVTADKLDWLRTLNKSEIDAHRQAVDPDVLEREIARYDAKDAAEVSRRIRATAGRDAAVDEIVRLYREALAEHAGKGRYDEDGVWRAGAYLYVSGLRLMRLAWRLDRRYGPIKYHYVLPAYQRVKRLLRPKVRIKADREVPYESWARHG